MWIGDNLSLLSLDGFLHTFGCSDARCSSSDIDWIGHIHESNSIFEGCFRKFHCLWNNDISIRFVILWYIVYHLISPYCLLGMFITMCLYGRRQDILHEGKIRFGIEIPIELGQNSLNYLDSQQKLESTQFLKTRQVWFDLVHLFDYKLKFLVYRKKCMEVVNLGRNCISHWRENTHG